MKQNIEKNDVIERCMSLGVHVTASLADLKLAKNRMSKLYTPPADFDLCSKARELLKEQYQVVLESYNFLIRNHTDIQSMFKHLKQYTVMSKTKRMNLSHWVYTSNENYDPNAHKH